MTRTVETLVAAARHEAGLTQATSDLREAVTAAVETRSPTPDGIEIQVALPRQPVRVSVEPDLLTRIVQPLVDNACRYGLSTVDVEVVRRGSAAYVTVVDDGPGVEDAESDLIFEPGERGSAAAAEGRGAGLGLSLARRLARGAGGDVTVTPSAAGGQFAVRLPLGR